MTHVRAAPPSTTRVWCATVTRLRSIRDCRACIICFVRATSGTIAFVNAAHVIPLSLNFTFARSCAYVVRTRIASPATCTAGGRRDRPDGARLRNRRNTLSCAATELAERSPGGCAAGGLHAHVHAPGNEFCEDIFREGSTLNVWTVA